MTGPQVALTLGAKAGDTVLWAPPPKTTTTTTADGSWSGGEVDPVADRKALEALAAATYKANPAKPTEGELEEKDVVEAEEKDVTKAEDTLNKMIEDEGKREAPGGVALAATGKHHETEVEACKICAASAKCASCFAGDCGDQTGAVPPPAPSRARIGAARCCSVLRLLRDPPPPAQFCWACSGVSAGFQLCPGAAAVEVAPYPPRAPRPVGWSGS